MPNNLYRVKRPVAYWEARVTRRGITHSKTFRDDRHGGSARAKAKAAKYRDQLVRMAARPAKSARDVQRGRMDGIQFRKHLGRKGTWIAQWVDPLTKKRKTRKFSCSRHGTLKAEQLARQARMLGVAGLGE